MSILCHFQALWGGMALNPPPLDPPVPNFNFSSNFGHFILKMHVQSKKNLKYFSSAFFSQSWRGVAPPVSKLEGRLPPLPPCSRAHVDPGCRFSREHRLRPRCSGRSSAVSRSRAERGRTCAGTNCWLGKLRPPAPPAFVVRPYSGCVRGIAPEPCDGEDRAKSGTVSGFTQVPVARPARARTCADLARRTNPAMPER